MSVRPHAPSTPAQHRAEEARARGTVSLALGRKPNGRHRAEVLKLIVRREARGRGLGRALLATAEQAAAGARRAPSRTAASTTNSWPDRVIVPN